MADTWAAWVNYFTRQVPWESAIFGRDGEIIAAVSAYGNIPAGVWEI